MPAPLILILLLLFPAVEVVLLARIAGADPFVARLASGRRFVAGALVLFPGVIGDALATVALLFPIRDRAPPPGDGVIEGEYRRLD